MSAPTLPYVVVVSDGHSIRTLHAPVFGSDLPVLDAIVARALGPAPKGAYSKLDRSSPEPRPPVSVPNLGSSKLRLRRTEAMLTQGELATAKGYTGNSCRDCGSFDMLRSGTCQTCESCGSTSGCS